MKTVIIFASQHHGNTKKLVDAIEATKNVTLIDATQTQAADLSEYDLIGFASGISFAKYYPSVLAFAAKNLPNGKNVFFLHTAGDPRENQNASMKAIADAKNCPCLGTYCCKGFDTFGPFKLIGGIAKGHPNAEDISEAITFYRGIAVADQ